MVCGNDGVNSRMPVLYCYDGRPARITSGKQV
jgi:hypothetical protein